MTQHTHLDRSNCLMLASAILPTDDINAQSQAFADEYKFTLFVFSLNCSIDPYAYEIYIKTPTNTYRHLVGSTTNNEDLKVLSVFISEFVYENYQSTPITKRIDIINQTFYICESVILKDAIKKIA